MDRKRNPKRKINNQRGWEDLKKCGYTWQRPRRKHRKGEIELQREFKENLPIKVKELEAKYPQAKIEVWFFDEYRIGLKPVLRKVWSKKGERPIAIVEHRNIALFKRIEYEIFVESRAEHGSQQKF